MGKAYKAAKQSVKAKNFGAHCNYQAPFWKITVRGLILGSSASSAKDAWINAKGNDIRGRIESAS